MDEMSADRDIAWMHRALDLARRAEGRVSPRPPVGSVVVSGEGEVVGRGWSRDGAGLHAETAALEEAGPRAKGATIYATLEPCLRWCTPAAVKAGVGRVVAATSDPNPEVDGKGFEALREAGIEVSAGILEDEARRLIEPFSKWIRTKLPFVTLKLAATLDGKVAAPDGTSRWITGEESRAEVHDMRRRADAVIVGSGTVVADDPALTFRSGEEGDQPLRVVLDSGGRTPVHAKVLDGSAPTVIFTVEANDAAERWSQAGAEVVVLARGDGGIDLGSVLRELGERGICHAVLEGGPTLAASFFQAGLVDRLLLYLAPKLIGGEAPGLLSDGVKTLADAWPMRVERIRSVGNDICIEARPEAA